MARSFSGLSVDDFRDRLWSSGDRSFVGREHIMVIVAGHLIVGRERRDAYLAGCAEVVEHARTAAGCLDFAISADLLDSSRINIFERWESSASVEAFRGSGPSDEQAKEILSASVSEFDIADHRCLT
jgi:quinol monooxygenase YgiN